MCIVVDSPRQQGIAKATSMGFHSSMSTTFLAGSAVTILMLPAASSSSLVQGSLLSGNFFHEKIMDNAGNESIKAHQNAMTARRNVLFRSIVVVVAVVGLCL